MPAVIANLDFVKEKNISAVFKIIVEQRAISRIQIARQCQLAAGSVTRIIRQLIDSGLVREIEAQNSDRGRPAVSLTANTGDIHILAISAGRHNIHFSLCDLSGNLLAEQNDPLTASTPEHYVQQITGTAQSFLKKQEKITKKLIGIGITTPGLVHSKTGVVHYMPHMRAHNLPLAEELTNTTGLPCFACNFSSAIALAEHMLETTYKCANTVLVSVHNGVGSGMILDGRLYEGSSLAAGEIGHIQIDPFGVQCYCGNFGCLESYVSNKAIEERCHQQVKAGVPSILTASSNIKEICRAANQSDELAIALLRKAASDLGRVMAMSINLLSPEKIILAGEITEAFDVIEPVIRQSLKQQTVSFFDAPEIQLVKSDMYSKRWLGAYALVRRALLEQGLLWQILKQDLR